MGMLANSEFDLEFWSFGSDEVFLSQGKGVLKAKTFYGEAIDRKDT